MLFSKSVKNLLLFRLNSLKEKKFWVVLQHNKCAKEFIKKQPWKSGCGPVKKKDRVGLNFRVGQVIPIQQFIFDLFLTISLSVSIIIILLLTKLIFVRWSSRMSRMSGISISRYIQLWYAIPFVSYCFQLDKIAYIVSTLSPIFMGFQQNKALWLLYQIN